MLGTTVLIPTSLVPLMGGGNEEKAKMIQTLLFVAGVNTLFGTRLPAVVGGSYTYMPTTISIILASRYTDIVNPQEKFERIMRGIQGALIAASTLQIVLGFSGLWRNVARFLNPLTAVPLVVLSGFGLSEFGFPVLAKCIEIGYTAINGFGPVHTRSRWFNDMINVPFSNEAFVAGSLAMFLDCMLQGKDNTRRKDCGMHFWEKYRSFKSNARSEEFYSLPFNLNKFFPSV
ncbi:hypothetical protein V6N11_075679 [Hibiscus sabdariffa]|uniref:Uncharacterized protein n=2 Tax=Hibiscus sabdariffa TaxID=183260 RepID=A0ABR2N6S5_9ROSI